MTYSISPDLLEILCCPEDRTPLALAPAELVDQLNQAIVQGGLKNKGGEAVAEALQAGLLREDKTILYPVREDIPVLLCDEGIPLGQLQED